MSRIGRMPVLIPPGVEVKIDGNLVTVKGPRGTLSRELRKELGVSLEDSKLIVYRRSDDKLSKSLHGLSRTLLANMVKGVVDGYEKALEISGVGYKAAKQGNKLVLSVGYSSPVEVTPRPGIEIEVPSPTRIVVKGIDKELVGQTAAEIRAIREPEPYKGKGIKYVDEHIRRKAGKAGKATGGKK
ncbi:MAG TPA: 50S ribosomal protein L6 [Firmicutes bacterium]|nr:50S ribosomal protein L6 [Bacillota bacterium]